MTDAQLLELVKMITLGRPDAQGPLFALLKDLSDRVTALEQAA